MLKFRYRPLLVLGVGLALIAGCTPPRALVSPSGASQDPVPTVSVDQGPVPTAAAAAQGWAYAEEPEITAPKAAYMAKDLLVSADPGASEDQVLARIPGAVITGRIAGPHPMWRLGLPAGTSPQAASRALSGVPGVRYAALNRVYKASYTFDPAAQDTYYPQQWAHQAQFANTQGAWDLLASIPDASASQNRVIVAVVDTGCDVGHPEFTGRIESPRNFTATNSLDPMTGTYPAATTSNVVDTIGHGTHVCGIIGAAGANGIGVAGVAWNVRLMPLKVFGGESAETFDLLNALYYAASYVASDGARVRVVNMSLGVAGLNHPEVAMEEAVSYLYDHGIVCAIAAGNEASPVTSPANTSRCIAVSSTSSSLGYEFLSGFSNFGSRIDVAAPGGGIWSTVPRKGSQIGGPDASANPYRSISGTSMAAPFVAGVAAMVISRYASESVSANQTGDFSAKVIARLQQTADDLGEPGRDALYGYGRVNARRAIEPSGL